ncbi:hypothetical protein [Nocardiopsis sp. NPDC006938]|uniref:hypothetical protein n=1 Tax=Nocardiopsis sp. NPDC006938 TaxID=3364337 RepID=UPI00369B9B3E
MTPKKYQVNLGADITKDLTEDQDHKPAPKKSKAKETAPPAGSVPAPMTLEQIAAVGPDRRRQLNCGVPEDLLLHRRTALYREDHGLGATRQNVVALAVDEWLRARGY